MKYLNLKLIARISLWRWKPLICLSSAQSLWENGLQRIRLHFNRRKFWGHKLPARLTGVFLTECSWSQWLSLIWPSVTWKCWAPTVTMTNLRPGCPSVHLHLRVLEVCPGKPHTWHSSNLQRQIFEGIYVPKVAKSNFRKINNIHCAGFGEIHRNTSAVWFWSLTS